VCWRKALVSAKEEVTMQLHLQVPEQFIGKSQQQLEELAFEALVVRLYALGELSSGEGARLLDLQRREFLDLLGQYNVSLFDNEIDFKKEAGYE
jgi:predicted HTH domain antitoxin